MIDYTDWTQDAIAAGVLLADFAFGWLVCDVFARKRARKFFASNAADFAKLYGWHDEAIKERNEARSALARAKSDLEACKSVAAEAQAKQFAAEQKVRLWTDRPRAGNRWIKRTEANAIAAGDGPIVLQVTEAGTVSVPPLTLAVGGGIASAFGTGAHE